MTTFDPNAPDVLIADLMVFPTGTDATHRDWDNLSDWVVHIMWRGRRSESGRGGYAVTLRGGNLQLSRAGNWAWSVQPFQQHQYRWATFDEALAAARASVNSAVVNGHTWAQWCAYRDERWPEVMAGSTN